MSQEEGEPSTKKRRLKQTSLLDCFKKQTAKTLTTSTCTEGSVSSRELEISEKPPAASTAAAAAGEMNASDTAEELSRRTQRDTLAAAAEIRRSAASSSRQTSEGGECKDALSVASSSSESWLMEASTSTSTSSHRTFSMASTKDCVSLSVERVETGEISPSLNDKKLPVREIPFSEIRIAESSTSNQIEASLEELSYNSYDASQSLFSESDGESANKNAVAACSSANSMLALRKGTPVNRLNATPACSLPLPPLKVTSTHAILFRPHLRDGDPPRSFPNFYRDVWDNSHVRMPCSPENLYPVPNQSGEKSLQSRWELIENSLLARIDNSLDLEKVILRYNSRYHSRWDFRGLHSFFTQTLDAAQAQQFFQNTLPALVKLALQMPTICTQGAPLLKKQENRSVTMSQLQAACFLANAFFCTFPRRNARQKQSEYSTFPDINFNKLFEGREGGILHRKAEKLKCIVHYFTRVTKEIPTGTLTFARRSLSRFPKWEKSGNTLSKLHVCTHGTIENDAPGMLQVDFANKFLGGGVLGHGLVQEEIRFLICPELIITRLIAESLDRNESILITGAERYSDYRGYSDSFQWVGDHRDSTPRDEWGRRHTEVVAIDALVFSSYSEQFSPTNLLRELNKAYCGFYGDSSRPEHLAAVATGNWGCGAFGGDPRLKALIQLMAATEAQRSVVYFTFDSPDLCHDINAIHQFLTAQKITVGELWGLLQKYKQEMVNKVPSINIYQYIYDLYQSYSVSTDEESVPSPPSQPRPAAASTPSDYQHLQ